MEYFGVSCKLLRRCWCFLFKLTSVEQNLPIPKKLLLLLISALILIVNYTLNWLDRHVCQVILWAYVVSIILSHSCLFLFYLFILPEFIENNSQNARSYFFKGILTFLFILKFTPMSIIKYSVFCKLYPLFNWWTFFFISLNIHIWFIFCEMASWYKIQNKALCFHFWGLRGWVKIVKGLRRTNL